MGELDRHARLTPEERHARGRGLRGVVPRGSHAGWEPPEGRPGPLESLRAQEAGRLPELLPVRHERMAESPLAFLRGAAVVMAADLAGTPVTGLTAQACGDAHLMNFGLYASPERTLLFDVNDFDETLRAPWEWDVKRLAASLVVAAADNGVAAEDGRAVARAAVRSYREQMRAYAAMGDLQVFYSRIRAEDMVADIPMAKRRRQGERVLRKAAGRGSLQALGKLTEVVDGELRIIEDPPLIVHADPPPDLTTARSLFDAYRLTLAADAAELLGGYHFVDAARKVVGVGSVGTRCHVVVLAGRDAGDPLVLQVKEAGRSVLEPYAAPCAFRHQGRRVVVGQRLMQSSSDPFLGWGSDDQGRDYYWRQLRDMKASVDVTRLDARAMTFYGAYCARSLALGHANTGDRIQIAGYLGSGEVFDEAVAEFAVAYARRNARDHALFRSVERTPVG
ncbi:DUF2252 domain-containing protein [Spirillospora sp. NPDC047279]|uniref:DUF2252 domain-containing protein n=1 Tax=Spirillospora sp. NPDC047279 TaxID=3155478 RepID=UPI0033E3AA88